MQEEQLCIDLSEILPVLTSIIIFRLISKNPPSFNINHNFKPKVRFGNNLGNNYEYLIPISQKVLFLDNNLTIQI